MADPIIPLDAHRKGKTAVGAALAAALVIAVPAAMKWEGKRNDPYLDIVKVQTVCYGETRVEMRHYSDAECKAMLARAIEQDYAVKVAQCVPEIADRPWQLAAASLLSYNIGVKAFCHSTSARLFRARDFKGGCRAIGRWNMAGGRVVQGLVNRRADEMRICMTGLGL